MKESNTITVCICTFKRPELVKDLVCRILKQRTNDSFHYSIIVVDNDFEESARDSIEYFKKCQSKIKLTYCVEPRQNISLARNRAIQNSSGEFIAFIDDDEIPPDNWLFNLYQAIKEYNADGVLAPVLPYFEEEPPRWVHKGHFFDRPSHSEGHTMAWEYTRTGNVLLDRRVFNDSSLWFDPQFGRGGEDRDFFRRKIQEGYRFVWCNQAAVHERIFRNRWMENVMVKRALIRGKMTYCARKTRKVSILQSMAAIALYTSCLPITYFFGYHSFIKYLVKNCDHIGKVLAFLGIDPVKEKYV